MPPDPMDSYCPKCRSMNRSLVFLSGEPEPIGILCIRCGYTQPMPDDMRWTGPKEEHQSQPSLKARDLIGKKALFVARDLIGQKAFGSEKAGNLVKAVRLVIQYLIERDPNA